MEQATRDSRSLAGEGPLPTLFSSEGRARVIEAFVRNSEKELNVSDIARLSDANRSTVYNHLEDLEELEIIKQVKPGGTTLYTLNSDSEVATLLNKLQGAMLKQLLDVEQNIQL